MAVKGGDKLEARLKEILAKVQNSTEVRVGFLEGATYEDGTSVAEVAAYNEYGVPSRNQPPRPFFRGMIKEKSPNWGESLSALLVKNNYDANKALALMGHGISGQLRESIQKFTSPGLAESTIAAKGGVNKPLIDTGHMFNSVDFEVKE